MVVSCKHCNRSFADYSNKRRHEQKCTGAPNTYNSAVDALRRANTEISRLQMENARLLEENTRLRNSNSDLLERLNPHQDESESAPCINDIMCPDTAHVGDDVMERFVTQYSADVAVMELAKSIYFCDDCSNNHAVYLKSTRHETAEVFTKNRWTVVAKHDALQRIIKRCYEMLGDHYVVSGLKEKDDANISNGNIQIVHTFLGKLMDIRFSTTSMLHHRTNQKLWSLIINRGKRGTHE